ncbi:MAG: class I SAM-dependent methyltransferase [Nitrospira sp.]
MERFDVEDLVRLNRYFTPPTPLAYDLESRRRRGLQRVARLDRRISLQGCRLLDVGCGHGELVWGASTRVQHVTGIDLNARNLSEASNEATQWPNVRKHPTFICGDAAALPLGAASYDVVTSYWALEHFADPMKVLQEFWRVLRGNGKLYLEFGPLFYSARGHHLYRFIYIPWAHLIFEEDVLFDYLRQRGEQDWIEAYRGLNRLTVGRFLQIVRQSKMEIEHLNCHASPIGRLPMELRQRLASHPEQDLRVSSVTCVLRKD